MDRTGMRGFQALRAGAGLLVQMVSQVLGELAANSPGLGLART